MPNRYKHFWTCPNCGHDNEFNPSRFIKICERCLRDDFYVSDTRIWSLDLEENERQKIVGQQIPLQNATVYDVNAFNLLRLIVETCGREAVLRALMQLVYVSLERVTKAESPALEPNKDTRPLWWPKSPYPQEFSTLSHEGFCNLVPDDHQRTRIAWKIGGEIWEIASEMIWCFLQHKVTEFAQPCTDEAHIFHVFHFHEEDKSPYPGQSCICGRLRWPDGTKK